MLKFQISDSFCKKKNTKDQLLLLLLLFKNTVLNGKNYTHKITVEHFCNGSTRTFAFYWKKPDQNQRVKIHMEAIWRRRNVF